MNAFAPLFLGGSNQLYIVNCSRILIQDMKSVRKQSNRYELIPA